MTPVLCTPGSSSHVLIDCGHLSPLPIDNIQCLAHHVVLPSIGNVTAGKMLTMSHCLFKSIYSVFSEQVSHGWKLTPAKCLNEYITFGEPTCVNLTVGERFQACLPAEVITRPWLRGLADGDDAARLVGWVEVARGLEA